MHQEPIKFGIGIFNTNSDSIKVRTDSLLSAVSIEGKWIKLSNTFLPLKKTCILNSFCLHLPVILKHTDWSHCSWGIQCSHPLTDHSDIVWLRSLIYIGSYFINCVCLNQIRQLPFRLIFILPVGWFLSSYLIWIQSIFYLVLSVWRGHYLRK